MYGQKIGDNPDLTHEITKQFDEHCVFINEEQFEKECSWQFTKCLSYL